MYMFLKVMIKDNIGYTCSLIIPEPLFFPRQTVCSLPYSPEYMLQKGKEGVSLKWNLRVISSMLEANSKANSFMLRLLCANRSIFVSSCRAQNSSVNHG